MALGIAAATAIFSFVHSILLAPLPFPDSERLALLQEYTHQQKVGGNPLRLNDWLAAPSVESVTGYYGENYTLDVGGAPERVHGLRTFGDFFGTFRLQSSQGRTFTEVERSGRGEAVAVISHSLWTSRFQRDTGIVGRTLRLNGKSCRVIGVLPASARFDDAEIIAPEPNPDFGRRARFLAEVARLRPGATLAGATAELETVAGRLAKQYPATDSNMSIRAFRLRDEMGSDARVPLLVLMGAVGFVVLMASINLANLFLSRTAGRHSELAVRVALGASRWHLIRMLLAESAMVAIAGGLLGALGSVWGVDLLRSIAPSDIPRLDEVRIDWVVAAFAAILTMGCALVTGLLPAWRNSNVNLAVRDGSRSVTSRHYTQQFLVAGQLALSLSLLVGGGLLFRSLWNLEHRPLGFAPDRLLTFRLSMPWQSDSEQLEKFYQRVLDSLSALPGVEGAALTDRLPLGGDSQSGDVIIAGRPEGSLEPGAKIGLRAASTNFHEVMHVPLRSGRYLDRADAPHRRTVINEAAARAYFKNENPIGHSIGLNAKDLYEVVGVVADLPESAREKQPQPAMYVPFGRTFWPLAHFVVRTRAEPASMTDAVRRQVAAIDSSKAIELVQTAEAYLATRNQTARLEAWMVGVFAAIAMMLAAIGIFGLVAGIVTERTTEIAIRMALGAEPRRVLQETLGRLGVQFAVGLVGGLALAIAAARWIESTLYGVAAADPATYALAAVSLSLVGVLAAWAPARRAARLDPAVALRRN